MFDYPIFQASPLMNALLQTLLLVLYPLVIALLAGGCIGIGWFFRSYPTLPEKNKAGSGYRGTLLFSYGYAAFFPLFYILARRFLGLSNGLTLVILLAVGGSIFLAGRLLGRLNKLDSDVLETALACGLHKGQVIQLVLGAMGKPSLAVSLCETSLFLLALSSFAGCLAGNGLAGLALSAADAWTFALCIVLLVLIVLLPVILYVRLGRKAAK